MLVSFEGKTIDPLHQGQRGFLQYRAVKEILSPPEEIKHVTASTRREGGSGERNMDFQAEAQMLCYLFLLRFR